VLRAFRRTDIDAWAAMEAVPEVRRYRGNNPRTRNQAWAAMEVNLGQWALRGYGVFALEAAMDARFAGIAGVLHPADWPEPELAYSLAPAFWGQGLAVEAAAAARNWAFARCGVCPAGELHRAREPALGPGRGEARRDTRGRYGAARHPGRMVGASARCRLQQVSQPARWTSAQASPRRRMTAAAKAPRLKLMAIPVRDSSTSAANMRGHLQAVARFQNAIREA